MSDMKSTPDAGPEAGEHNQQDEQAHLRHERVISFLEAVLLSVVALVVAWPGYSSAEWGTRSSDLLAN